MNLSDFYKPAINCGIAVIWFLVIASHFAEYDTNILLALAAFLISTIITLINGFSLIFRSELFNESAFSSFLFFLTSSPPAIWFLIEIYTEFVGQFHKF